MGSNLTNKTIRIYLATCNTLFFLTIAIRRFLGHPLSQVEPNVPRGPKCPPSKTKMSKRAKQLFEKEPLECPERTTQVLYIIYHIDFMFYFS